MNGAIMQVLNLCLVFVLLMFAYLSVFRAEDMINEKIGRSMIIAIALFWFIRAFYQAVFFGSKVTGAPLIGTIIGTSMFAVGGLLYLIPYLQTRSLVAKMNK
jgi:predicted neutral ceramidase superfamily lipid hydrolase